MLRLFERGEGRRTKIMMCLESMAVVAAVVLVFLLRSKALQIDPGVAMTILMWLLFVILVCLYPIVPVLDGLIDAYMEKEYRTESQAMRDFLEHHGGHTIEGIWGFAVFIMGGICIYHTFLQLVKKGRSTLALSEGNCYNELEPEFPGNAAHVVGTYLLSNTLADLLGQVMLILIGWGLVVLSLVVIGGTFPGKGTVLLPGLVPVFNSLFAVVYLAMQYGLVSLLKSKRGVITVTAVAVIGMLVAWGAHATDIWGYYAEYGMSRTRTVLCGGACSSGLALGAALVRQWIGINE